MLIGNNKILVSTNALESKAQEVQAQIRILQNAMQEMDSKVQNVCSYWVGNASQEYKKRYDSRSKKASEVFDRLKEHPEDLLKMAGVYKRVEEENKSIINVLSGDVIE